MIEQVPWEPVLKLAAPEVVVIPLLSELSLLLLAVTATAVVWGSGTVSGADSIRVWVAVVVSAEATGGYPPALGSVYSADAASEMDMLKADADYMQKSLDAINRRIDELRVKPSKAP